MEENKAPVRPVKPILNTMPHTRFYAQLAVQGDALYMFGGTFEQGDRGCTFAEMHAIDLGKLDGVTEIYRKEVENWQGDHAESESDSYEDDDSEDEVMDDEEGSSGIALPASEISAAPSTVPENQTKAKDDPHDEEVAPSEPVIVDIRPQPRPFEGLRASFVRSSNAWQILIMEDPKHKNSASDQFIKELKKAAFEIAETKW